MFIKYNALFPFPSFTPPPFSLDVRPFPCTYQGWSRGCRLIAPLEGALQPETNYDCALICTQAQGVMVSTGNFSLSLPRSLLCIWTVFIFCFFLNWMKLWALWSASTVNQIAGNALQK